MAYRTVLIIGNGFDLNLRLETGYTHFIKSTYFNTLVESGNKLCKYLKDKQELQNWIDIENELKTYSRDIYKEDNRKPFKNEYIRLRQALCDYLNSLDLTRIDTTSRAYEIIKSMPSGTEDLLVINFNYTGSVNYILDYSNKEVSVLHIHGKAKNNQIVFGVEDGARINDKDIFLLKSSCFWNKIEDIDTYLSEASRVIFLGYSLGETDHHYFGKFFRNACHKNPSMGIKSIFISHYGEEGYDDILRQIDAMTLHNLYTFRSNLHNDLEMTDFAK